MSWVTIIWSMTAAACLTLALLHCLIWFKNRQARANLALAAAAMAVAGVAAAELLVMHARTPDSIAAAMRWMDVSMFVLVAALVGFVRLDFRTGRPWLGWTALALRFVSLGLNFTTGTTDNYREIQQLSQLNFLGVPVSVVARAVGNPWGHVSELSMFLLLVFVVDAAVRLGRIGTPESQRRARVVGGSLAGFILISAGFSALVENQMIHWPYLVSLPFLAIVLVMNHELSRDVVHAAQLSGELQERLRFETLLADISSNFINLPAGEVDREIEGAQRRVCELLRIDLSALWQWTQDAPRHITITHLYRPFGGPPPPDRIDGEDLAPWCLRELTAGKIVAVSTMKSAPPEAARDVEVWRHYGIKSALCLPLSTGGQLIGALTFNTVREECDWSEAFINRLTLVAQVFANALVRKRAELALRESEERLHLAAEAAGAGLWILHSKTGCFWLTKKTRELFGITSEADLPLEHFLHLIHPADQERIREAIQNVQKSGAEASMEYRTVDSGKGVRWMSSRGRVQRDAAGEPARLMGVTMDITQRKLVEEKQRQLSLAVEQSPASVIITDAQGNIIYVNKKFSEVSGYSLAESLGQNPRLLKSNENPPALYQELWACLASGETWRGEFRNRKKNGELYWESAVISPLHDDAGRITHFVGIKEDITERKRSESEVTRQRNELAHLARVTTLSTLSSSLAHELNQPLGIILSNAQAAQELLAQDPPVVAEVGEILADIVAADRRAAEVIQRLRALMKRGEVSRQPLQLNDLLEEVLRLVQAELIGRGVTPVCNLTPDLPLITGDRVQLQQIALNLILNAADAMAVNAPGLRRLYVTTTWRGQTVRTSVRDEGAGLPADVESLFQPFYTTKAHGLGMGLAICRSIITAHQGKLWAEPHPGRGAVFQFELPVANSPDRP